LVTFIFVKKANGKRSFQILLNAIKKSNLYKNTNIIRLGIVNDSGIIINDSILEDKKFDIIHTGNSEQYERPTLLHMRNMAEFDKIQIIIIYIQRAFLILEKIMNNVLLTG
jgi:hypothetical protein